MELKGYNLTLQELYNVGKNNQDKELEYTDSESGIDSYNTAYDVYEIDIDQDGDTDYDFSSATDIVDTFETQNNIDFGTYKEGLAKTLSEMTRIEAFLYLQEVFNRLDEADGRKNQQVNTDKYEITTLFDISGIGSYDPKKYPGARIDPRQIPLDNLADAAEYYKADDNPADNEHIELLQLSQTAVQPPQEGDPLFDVFKLRENVTQEFDDDLPKESILRTDNPLRLLPAFGLNPLLAFNTKFSPRNRNVF